MGLYSPETLEASDAEIVNQAIDAPGEQEDKLKQLFESRAINLKSINERNQALRAHIESKFSPEQREQRDAILANLKKAHDKTLTEMREEGIIGPEAELAQKYFPNVSTKTKLYGAIATVAVTPLVVWGLLKWFGRKTKEKTVAAAQATGRVAKKTTGFFEKLLAWSAVGAIGFFGFDHLAWGGSTRKKLAGYLADKTGVDKAETTATA